MEKNIGETDKMIRYILTIVLIVMGVALSYWWFVLAAIVLLTAWSQYSPLYSIFKCNTLEKTAKKEENREVKSTKKAKKKK